MRLPRLLEFSRREIDLSPVGRVLTAPALAAMAASMAGFFILVVALHVGSSRSSWHFDVAPPGFRFGVLSFAILQALPLAFAISALSLAGRASSRLLRWSAGAAVGLVLYVWLSSWAVFQGTGQFLNKESLLLAIASPGSTFAHLAEFALAEIVLFPLLAALLAASLLYVAARVWGAPQIVRAVPIVLLSVALVVAAYVESMSRIWYSTSTLVQHPVDGSTVRMWDLFDMAKVDRSAPTAHLRAELARGPWMSQASADVPVEWRERSGITIPAPMNRWNVVVIVVESLRSDELAAYGSQLDVMPAVDAVSEESAVFVDHYAVATHSNYASVVPVSSQFPMREPSTHVYPKVPPYPRVHLYDVLKPHGYRTAIISSQNENWGGMLNYLNSPNLDYILHSENYQGSTYVDERDWGFARFVQRGYAGKIDDKDTIDEAIKWVGDASTAQPFVVYINLQNSHVPYPIPESAPTPFGRRKPAFTIGFNHFPVDSAAVVRGVYRNALHYVDAQIGRLVDHLKSNGSWEHTVFVIVGDHGQAFFEHGFAAHGNRLYEELLRTPLVIRAPGLAPGPRTGLAQQVDIAPTILDLLGIPQQPFFQGISLLDGPRRFAYSVVQTSLANQYGIISNGHKVIVDVRDGSIVLRDLQIDPLERFDHTQEMRQEKQRLLERLDTWRAVQLRYYDTPSLQATHYAPVLPE